MTATAWDGPLGAVELRGGDDLDALQVWDDAVRRLRPATSWLCGPVATVVLPVNRHG